MTHDVYSMNGRCRMIVISKEEPIISPIAGTSCEVQHTAKGQTHTKSN